MKMIRRLAMIALALAALLAAPGLSKAQKALTVGVEELDYYPQYRWADGQYTGYARDVLDAFAKDKGYQLTYKAFPVTRLFKEFLAEQSVDLKYPDSPFWSVDAKKDVKVVYSDPVADYIDGVMVAPGRKDMPKGDLKILGLVRGFTPFEYLDDEKAGTITLDPSDDYAALLKKCVAGRVDGAYGNLAVANWNLEENLKQPGALAFAPGLPHTKGSYLMSSIKHPEAVEEFNAWLKDNQALVETLKAKYKVEAGVK